MFNKKFWLDAADSFAVAAATVLVIDAPALISAGSWEQFAVIGFALARASVIAGVRAIAPRVFALAKSRAS